MILNTKTNDYPEGKGKYFNKNKHYHTMPDQPLKGERISIQAFFSGTDIAPLGVVLLG